MITHKTISLADQVFEHIENDILSGKYTRGEIITEGKLSAELGVSRTPIREALRRLSQEHLIEESGKGSVVIGISEKDLDDIFLVRKQLECLAVSMAATNSTPEQLDELKEEVMAIFRKEIQQRSKKNSEFNLTIFEHWEHAFYLYKTNGEEAGLFEGIAKYLYAILAFLFIPALNLCGMISTRMNNRLDEIGVRRSYGATKGQIISQVLCENLLLTFIGAILGLLLSYLMVCSGYSWILTLFEKGGHLKVVSGITFEMLFNPTIIAVVLLVTFVLNVASALLPTMIALKKDIVQSLYQRR